MVLTLTVIFIPSRFAKAIVFMVSSLIELLVNVTFPYDNFATNLCQILFTKTLVILAVILTIEEANVLSTQQSTSAGFVYSVTFMGIQIATFLISMIDLLVNIIKKIIHCYRKCKSRKLRKVIDNSRFRKEATVPVEPNTADFTARKFVLDDSQNWKLEDV